jgi:chromosome segregation ATPase
MSISIDTVTDAIIGKLDAENKALEAEVERLERYLFAARAQVNELEVQQRQADREREVFSTEVGRLAHALAAMEGQCDKAKAEVERLTARIPDSADLTRVVTLAMQAVGATENLYDFGCVARVVKTLPDRATLEVKNE